MEERGVAVLFLVPCWSLCMLDTCYACTYYHLPMTSVLLPPFHYSTPKTCKIFSPIIFTFLKHRAGNKLTGSLSVVLETEGYLLQQVLIYSWNHMRLEKKIDVLQSLSDNSSDRANRSWHSWLKSWKSWLASRDNRVKKGAIYKSRIRNIK